MDPITHTLAGAVLARVGGERRTPLAMATLLLAANAPDLDIFSVWIGSFSSLAFRRGWTHGPPALLILSFAVTGLILAWDRFVRRRRDPSLAPVDARWIWILALIGCVSHPMLDWLNTYGIRLLMPFSDRWFYGDAVFIVDPWWWALLIATLVFARRRFSPRVVRAAAAVALAYPLSLLVLSRVGDAKAWAAAEAAGIKGIREILYQPRPLDPRAAEIIVVTDSAYHFGDLRWGRAPRVTLDGPVVARGDWTDPRVVIARQDPDVRDYLVWSRFPYVAIETRENGSAVRFGDARFLPGRIPAGGLSGLRIPVTP